MAADKNYASLGFDPKTSEPNYQVKVSVVLVRLMAALVKVKNASFGIGKRFN